VRVQKATHTKGIVVDGERTLIGSRNWSRLGTTRNRDATLRLDDPGVAVSYARIFLHDRENLATTRPSGERGMPRIVPSDRVGQPPPPGLMRVYYDD
jgi:phosphatidylserine/phosphatidylglycerophosphate/cardiolipin synthase-like enzyme